MAHETNQRSGDERETVFLFQRTAATQEHSASNYRKESANVISIILLHYGYDFWLFMAALRSRCGHYIFALWFLMVALWNMADHYIFMLWFVLLLLLLFPRQSQPPQIGCLPYFHTWCGLSANFRCRSETCCTRLTENARRKKVAKYRHLGTIAQLCRAISSQLRHISTIGKKLVK